MKMHFQSRLNVLEPQVQILDEHTKRIRKPHENLPKRHRLEKLSKSWLGSVDLRSLAMLASSGEGDCCDNPLGRTSYTVINDYQTDSAMLPGGMSAWCGVGIDILPGVDSSTIYVGATYGVWTQTNSTNPGDVRFRDGGFKGNAGYYICWNRIDETHFDTQLCPSFNDGEIGNQFQTA